jgi:hypothetical protein
LGHNRLKIVDLSDNANQPFTFLTNNNNKINEGDNGDNNKINDYLLVNG